MAAKYFFALVALFVMSQVIARPSTTEEDNKKIEDLLKNLETSMTQFFEQIQNKTIVQDANRQFQEFTNELSNQAKKLQENLSTKS